MRRMARGSRRTRLELARRLKSQATECKARLRGLDRAVADYSRKDHTLRATVAKPVFA